MIKEEWIINNGNILGLLDTQSIPMGAIQYSILEQTKNFKEESFREFLDFEIDIDERIPYTPFNSNLTIRNILKKYFDDNITSEFPQNRPVKIYFILTAIQLWLFKEYATNPDSPFTNLDRYKKNYQKLRDNFLSTNIDTDESDFIKKETKYCKHLKQELKKAVYSELFLVGDDFSKPSTFKKNVLNSIDKRKDFLKGLQNKLENVKTTDDTKDKLNIDFEKWLKQDDLFDYHNNSPEQQKDIFEPQQPFNTYSKIKKPVQSSGLSKQDKAIVLNIDYEKTLDKIITNVKNLHNKHYNSYKKPLHKPEIIKKEEFRFMTFHFLDPKKDAISQKNSILNAYDDLFDRIKNGFENDILANIEIKKNKKTIFNLIQQNIEHYRDLAHIHIGWLNINLFTQLWAYAEMYKSWQKPQLTNTPSTPDESIDFKETRMVQETVEIKPVFKSEFVQIVFDVIKDFFSPEHQLELKEILETGNNLSNKLLFKSNGNRLTDTFKKLIEYNFITGCQKTDLINWIISNFTFLQNKTIKSFIYDTVEKTISRNHYPCKSPLIEIKDGQIQKVEQGQVKKYKKY